MLKAIIVDDEERSRKNLTALLEKYCNGVAVLFSARSVDEGLEAIANYHPDMVFLDIQMQTETGFDLLNKLPEINFEIIFTTAHAEYAIDAIRFSAIDYLLKPIDINDLRQAVARVEKKLMTRDFKEQIETLLHNFRSDSSDSYRLAVPSSDGLVFVSIKDILFCEADGNYTKIRMKDNKSYMVAKTLKEYDNLLSRHKFSRVHHSYLVNLNEIKQYVRSDGGYIVMNNSDASIPVSNRKKDAFFKMTEDVVLKPLTD